MLDGIAASMLTSHPAKWVTSTRFPVRMAALCLLLHVSHWA